MIPNKLLYLILLFTPISNIFHHYFTILIFGYSFWNTFIVLFLIHLLFFLNKIHRNDILIIIFFLFLASIISFIRSILYEVDFLLTLINFWPLYAVLIFLISIKELNISKKIISNICLFHTLLYAIIGTLFILELPTIEIQSEFTSKYLSDQMHRYEGILSASNLHANYLVTFFFIYLLTSKKNNIILLILLPTVLLSIIATGSRGPFLIYFLILFYFLFKNYKIISIASALLFCYLALNFALTDLDIRVFQMGFFDESRVNKNLFFLSLLKSNFLETLAFGIKPSLQITNSISISDNSFTLIILNYGIVFFIFWILLIKSTYYGFFSSMIRNKIFFISILIIFSINNAIVYLGWLLFIITYIHIISQNLLYTNKKEK